MEERLSIRAAAERYHVSARTLRFYEEAGILTASRKDGSRYREYDSVQIRRLEVILLLRRLSFGVQEVAALLRGDVTSFQRRLQKRIEQSDRALLEARESNRLLRSFSSELNKKAPNDISVENMLREFVYLTKQTERMIPMTAFEASPFRIAIGTDIAVALTNENGGGLIEKIKRLRTELMVSGGPSLPTIRIYDAENIPLDTVILYWNSKEESRMEQRGQEPWDFSEEIIAKIKSIQKLNCCSQAQ